MNLCHGNFGTHPQPLKKFYIKSQENFLYFFYVFKFLFCFLHRILSLYFINKIYLSITILYIEINILFYFFYIEVF